MNMNIKGYICTTDLFVAGQTLRPANNWGRDIPNIFDSILHICRYTTNPTSPNLLKYEVTTNHIDTVTIVREIGPDEFTRRSTGIYHGLYEKLWYVDGELHREDGPAMIGINGSRQWYIDGHLHREDGPAIVNRSSANWWWINGLPVPREN